MHATSVDRRLPLRARTRTSPCNTRAIAESQILHTRTLNYCLICKLGEKIWHRTCADGTCACNVYNVLARDERDLDAMSSRVLMDAITNILRGERTSDSMPPSQSPDLGSEEMLPDEVTQTDLAELPSEVYTLGGLNGRWSEWRRVLQTWPGIIELLQPATYDTLDTYAFILRRCDFTCIMFGHYQYQSR